MFYMLEAAGENEERGEEAMDEEVGEGGSGERPERAAKGRHCGGALRRAV